VKILQLWQRYSLVLLRKPLRLARHLTDLIKPSWPSPSPRSWNNLLAPITVDQLEPHRQDILARAERSLAHRFDLLGSGPVVVHHGMACRGFAGYRFPPGPTVEVDPLGDWLEGRINNANLCYAKRLWAKVAPGYTPIDWQIDFRSGYRWSEKCWYRNIRFGHKAGVDVKIPWELGRMQHLPTLALAYGLTYQNDRKQAERYVRELRNQILDFMANNPPRWGVNWRTSMDVGLRAVSWIFACDLLYGFGYRFDEAFEKILASALYAHGHHIATNLEWDPQWRANHYYFNVVCLSFIAAGLPRGVETDTWLAYGVQEFLHESKRQFHPEGSHFEGSTAYHAFVTEALAFGAALLAGFDNTQRHALQTYRSCRWCFPTPLAAPDELTKLFPNADLPSWLLQRLACAGQFLMDITQGNGEIIQIGDNDSGRFLKIDPAMGRCGERPVETSLDPRPIGAALYGLLDLEEWREFSAPHNLNQLVMRALLGTAGPLHRAANGTKNTLRIREPWQQAARHTQRWHYALPSDILLDVKAVAYPDFGLWLFRGPRLQLSIRCGPIGQHGRGAHDHNDQLGLTLCIDGEPVIQDPGAYVYTALPEERNRYRSVRAHHAPRLAEEPEAEPADLQAGIFFLGDMAQGKCLVFEPTLFVGRHQGFGFFVWRRVSLGDRGLTIVDYCDEAPLLNPGRITKEQALLPFSPGYGRKDRHGSDQETSGIAAD